MSIVEDYAVKYVKEKIGRVSFIPDPDLFLFKEGSFAIMREWNQDDPSDNYYIWDMAKRDKVSLPLDLDSTIRTLFTLI